MFLFIQHENENSYLKTVCEYIYIKSTIDLAAQLQKKAQYRQKNMYL